MKRVIGLLLAGGIAVAVTGCGGDNTTTFVLTSGSPGASAGSASASASASASSAGSPASSSLPTTAATPIPNGLRVIIDSPDGGSPITSPVEVSGTASVANGQVLVVVRDGAGNELGRATTTASASRPDYGHYDATVSFSGATSGAKGEIRVMDAATQKNYYFITIRFG
jgi:Immunoglobulin-like domain of bacterial spore germination